MNIRLIDKDKLIIFEKVAFVFDSLNNPLVVPALRSLGAA